MGKVISMDDAALKDCQSCGRAIEAIENNRYQTRLENNSPDGYTAHYLWLCETCWLGLLNNSTGEWTRDDGEGQSPEEAELND